MENEQPKQIGGRYERAFEEQSNRAVTIAADAQRLLAELAGGMEFATETLGAKTALERLSRRAVKSGE